MTLSNDKQELLKAITKDFYERLKRKFETNDFISMEGPYKLIQVNFIAKFKLDSKSKEKIGDIFTEDDIRFLNSLPDKFGKLED